MRRSVSYTVPSEWDGRPVKEFIRRYLGLSSRVLVKQKQTEGGVLKNGEPCRSVDLLAAGDILELCFPEESEQYEPVEGPLSILWESEDYLVVDKPSRMPVHPSPGHDRDSLLNRVAFYYGQTGQSPAFRPLYRLDRDTSGIVAIGKHRVAVSSAQVDKVYYAVCQGELSGCGTVDLPIGLEPGSKIRRQCGEGQMAVTHWKAFGFLGGTHTSAISSGNRADSPDSGPHGAFGPSVGGGRSVWRLLGEDFPSSASLWKLETPL